MNHKPWKLNAEDSWDPNIVTASIWLLHKLSKVPSALSQTQAHNAEAIPAIWKHRVTVEQTRLSSVLYQRQQLERERGMWSSAFY